MSKLSIPRNSGIYLIANIKNGKVYIGQAVSFRKRWNDHKRKLNIQCHCNKHLQAAWNKYGEKAFKFRVLEFCSVDQLNEREQHFLNIYMPKGICYNIAQDVTAPMRGRKMDEEFSRKISERFKGKKFTEDHVQKMTEARKNRSPLTEEARKRMSDAHKGKTISPEQRRKLSEANKGRMVSEETRRKLSEAATRQHARNRINREDAE